jgi:uncharacterized protein YdaU (DUF1376 family)
MNPWFKRYVGDYLRDTSHLSLSEDGAYNRLLDRYYAASTPLPADLERCTESAAPWMTRNERPSIVLSVL